MATAAKRLRKARKTRTQIASAFRALENGNISVEDVLEHPSATLMRVKIYDVLRRTPKLGVEGAKKVLRHSDIWPMDRLGTISLEKRRSVIENLPPRARTR